MEEIRQLTKSEHKDFMHIVLKGYPRFKMPFEPEAIGFQEMILHEGEDPSIAHIGYFRDTQLLGVMRFHDLSMNFFSKEIPVGGMGMLEVDLLHKKEKIAKKMMLYYLDYYHQKRTPLLIIYPFSTEFYRKMGFGYGSKIYQYRLLPGSLRNRGAKNHLRYLGKEKREALLSCYIRVFKKTHGLIRKNAYELNELFDNPDNIIVGFEKNGRISGYIVFTFQRGIERDIYADNRYKNDIYVKEFVYESSEALGEILSFLASQYEQVNRIIINTHDEDFHHLLTDPGNGSDNVMSPLYHESSVSGVGLMYRVIGAEGLFSQLKNHSFADVTCTLRFDIEDSFYEKCSKSFTVHFENGFPQVLVNAGFDIEVRMDISDFSSLMMGVVSFNRLYEYGLAEVSDKKYIGTINMLFSAKEKPVCLTGF